MQYNTEFWNALDELVNNSEIVIDRPKGTSHPKYPDFIYRVDYGYLKDTSSMDGAGIDVWVGSGEKKVDAIMCIVDLMKKDSEIKILIGCTDEEKRMHMETLTPALLNELVEKIEVYSIEGKGKNRTQRIIIHYRFFGVIENPVKEDNVVLEARQGVAVEYLTA